MEYESSVISGYLDYKETEDFPIENLLKLSGMEGDEGIIEHLSELEDSLKDWKRYQKVGRIEN